MQDNRQVENQAVDAGPSNPCCGIGLGSVECLECPRCGALEEIDDIHSRPEFLEQVREERERRDSYLHLVQESIACQTSNCYTVIVCRFLGSRHMDLKAMKGIERESYLRLVHGGRHYTSLEQLHEGRGRGRAMAKNDLDLVDGALILDSQATRRGSCGCVRTYISPVPKQEANPKVSVVAPFEKSILPFFDSM
jgi:hypothetical protein